MQLKAARKICIFILLFLISVPLYAREEKVFCAVYFTGIGCNHCRKSDPVLLSLLLKDNPGLIIIEYEMNRERKNARLIAVYNSNYGCGIGIPLLIFNKQESMSGDKEILDCVVGKDFDFNKFPLPDGSGEDFSDLDISALGGRPKIWRDGRILICKGEQGNSDLLKELLLADNLWFVLEKIEFEEIEPEPVLLSGGEVEFENAVRIDDWIFQWDRKKETKTFLFYPESE